MQSNKKLLYLVLLVGVTLTLFAIGLLWFLSKEPFAVSNLRLLDESKRSDTIHHIVEIEQRPNPEFDITTNDELVIAFAFLVRGYQIDSSGGINLAGTMSIQQEGQPPISADITPLYRTEDWKERPPVKRVGAENVQKFLSPYRLPFQREPIPYLVVLHDAGNDQILEGPAQIKAQITDRLSGQTAIYVQDISFKYIKK